MSSRAALLCVVVAIVSAPATAGEQSASKVIERYIDAIGGKKTVETITSTDVSGRVSSADGQSGVFTQSTRRPQLFYLSLSWGNSRWRTGFNGRSVWQDDARDGLRTLYGSAASRLRAEASYANTHFVISEQPTQVLVAGQDQVRGHAAIVLVALSPDGTKRTLFFDASSYLLLKDEQQTEGGSEERFFDDYRAVDRVMEPYRIEWHRNGETLRLTVERVTHNTPLDSNAFDAPSTSPEPPLDIDAILSAAGRNEQQLERIRQSYAYTQTETEGRIDEKGRVTQHEGPSYEFFHLGGRPVARLIRKTDGEALTEAERLHEEDRVKNIVREYERERLAGRAERRGQEEHTTRGLMQFWVPMGRDEWFPAYRRMSDFSHIRREQVRGRPAVVVEFQPKQGVTPHNDFERQAGRMAGALWIDEASQFVIRVESFLRDDFDRIGRGSSMRAERTLVGGEVWLPSQLEINIRGNFVFGKSAHFLITMKYADYKKFTVEATVRSPQP